MCIEYEYSKAVKTIRTSTVKTKQACPSAANVIPFIDLQNNTYCRLYDITKCIWSAKYNS